MHSKWGNGSTSQTNETIQYDVMEKLCTCLSILEKGEISGKKALKMLKCRKRWHATLSNTELLQLGWAKILQQVSAKIQDDCADCRQKNNLDSKKKLWDVWKLIPCSDSFVKCSKLWVFATLIPRVLSKSAYVCTPVSMFTQLLVVDERHQITPNLGNLND